MGTLELEYRRRRRRTDIKKILLRTVATAGVMSIALLAPNVLGAIAKLGLLPTGRQKDSVRAARKRLVDQGLLKYKGNLLFVTEKGEKILQVLELRDYQIPKPKKWDGQWRVLIFDISEKRKGLREKVRRTLAKVGFLRLQDSVWIYPYPCEDLLVLLKADFNIGKEMLYMIVDTLERDAPFRHSFGLL